MPKNPVPEFARRIGRVRPSAIRELLRLGDDPTITSFGGGYPDPALFPVDDLREIYERLLTREHALSLQYTASTGLPVLREQIAERMTADGMPCTADDILVIQGGQQGLDLCGRLVLDPGDVVVTENPTFLGALIAFNPCEPRYAAVPVDAQGMDTDALEQVLTDLAAGSTRSGSSAGSMGSAHSGGGRARLLYTIPDFQNPSGVTMSLERRQRLIELASRHNLLVVEDTPYRSLRYEGHHLPTLKSLDTEGRVVHLGSFSKILAPGMRLGWALARPEILGPLGLLKLAADTQCSTLNMAATSAYLAAHDIDVHIGAMCTAYRA
ncbi:MAG: PLP-dependent aminotransferase family protein, partial [Lapillicoccus sp.]